MPKEYAVLKGGDGKKWSAYVDSGDLHDKAGKQRKWPSEIVALNELAEERWSLVTAGLLHPKGEQPVTALYLVRERDAEGGFGSLDV